MGIPVKLQVFEGPLDLLLHLIEKNKIDIYDIPIVEITNQYMEYIKAMQKEDLNIMSEFLVMAATLLDIKCRMLLPKEVNEEGEEEDPRQELVEQLLEYKMYKFMSYELKDRELDGDRIMYKTASIPDEVKGYVPPVDLDKLLGDLTLVQLNRIFKEVMKRQESKVDPVRSKFGKIEKEEVTLPDKLDYVTEYARSHRKFGFRALLKKQSSKVQVVVTFLAILQLMKEGVILAGDLYIYRTVDEIDGRIMSYLLNHQANKAISCIAQGKSVVHVQAKELRNITVVFPFEMGEQRKIADCLASMDEVIQKSKDELAKWQELKKGLLQQMFV